MAAPPRWFAKWALRPGASRTRGKSGCACICKCAGAYVLLRGHVHKRASTCIQVCACFLIQVWMHVGPYWKSVVGGG